MAELKLWEVFRNDFDIGAAVNVRTVDSAAELIKAHYSSMTAENEMKPVNTQPAEGVFTFEQADKIADFAARHGKKLRGHTLVWHNQTPDWFFEAPGGGPADKETLLRRMRDHIRAVAGRYKGRTYCWDVVNEAVADEGEQWLRPSKWHELAGPEFIVRAFEYAHEADPDALLFYNDYNECNPAKRDKIIRLVKWLKEQGAPIHGIGMQGHYNLESPSIAEVREAIERYAELGLVIHVTELDMSVYAWDDRRTDLEEPTPEMLERQAERYEQLFALYREYRDVIRSVTFWGAADDYTWLSHFPVRGRRNWPLLFDERHRPKEAFRRVVRTAGVEA